MKRSSSYRTKNIFTGVEKMKKRIVKIAASAMSVCTIAAAMPNAIVAQAAGYFRPENSMKYQELVDHERNICIVSDGVNQVYDGAGSGDYRPPSNLDPLKRNQVKDASTWNTKVKIMNNVEKVYDFFERRGHTDFDFSKSGNPMFYVFEYDQPGYASSNNFVKGRGLGSFISMNWIGLGKGNDDTYSMGFDRGVIGHEFTHFILTQKLGWIPKSGKTETEALMEAYCDILGELCEDNPDWMVAGDIFKDNSESNMIYSLRNMRNPKENKNKLYDCAFVNFYDDYYDYMCDIDMLKENNPYQKYMNACYLGTTVIDRAASLMYDRGIPKEELADIWYNSMQYYTGDVENATFHDCRNAVVEAATRYYGSSNNKMISIIEQAFDEVNVTHRTRLSQASAEDSKSMSYYFLRAERSKFPEGEYWNTGDPNTTSTQKIYYDKSTSLPMGPTAFSDFSDSNWENEEPYYQCAGFAKKIQEDYYGTNTFVQSADLSYTPQPGDHLRLNINYKGREWSHSVFVYGVIGNTIYYADCNSDGYNVIHWDNKMTFDASSGRFYLENDSSIYTFAWVERPLKLGDVNADGVIDKNDLDAMNNIINGNAEIENHDVRMRQYAADINGDYKVDNADRKLLEDLYYNRNGARSAYGYVIY